MVREDAQPGVIATLEATDADEGAYGQVVYHLQEVEADVPKFSISTQGGKAVVRLVGSLDYEKQTLHQLKVLAVDRAKQGRVNTGTAALLIKVQDVEDQPPEFVRVQPVARVPEGTPVGTPILQGAFQLFVFSLISLNLIFLLIKLFIISKFMVIIALQGTFHPFSFNLISLNLIILLFKLFLISKFILIIALKVLFNCLF